ncbi:MAG: hypothetical protein RLY86_2352 [Pseudomonadota bacterium]|jgi:cytoskeletal protein RodZ
MSSRKRRYFDVIASEPGPGGNPGTHADGGTGGYPPGPQPPRHIGEVLQQRREELGYALPDLAATLRIRLPYLEAIEQGRWTDLPGQAYVVGFLRSYATTLGLDPGSVLARFKQDSAGIEQTAELYFPEPVSENRMPSGMLVLTAVLLAALAYGGWYVVTSDERSLVERVQELPERIAALIPGGPEAPPADEPAPAPVLPADRVEELIGRSQPTAPEVGATNAPEVSRPPTLPPDAPSATLAARQPEEAGPGQTTTGTAPAGVTADATAAGSGSAPAAPQGTTPGTTPGTTSGTAPGTVPTAATAALGATPGNAPLDAPTADAGAGEESEVPQLPPDLAPPLTLDSEGRPVVTAGSDQSGTDPAAADGTATAAETGTTPTTPGPIVSAEDVPTAPATGRVFGQTTGPSRVSVRAVEDSWIEIRDEGGTLWAARNLRPGDVFRAPDVQGLRLTVVGNAAGIVLGLDGQETRPLGGRGQVVRDVSLTPEDVAVRLGR